MSYTQNPTWTSSTVITVTALDNLETQYAEAYSYLTAHAHDSNYYLTSYMSATYWNAAIDGPGSGADADLLYKASGNLHAASFYGLGVASGIIIMWYGSVASIPSGWILCNGSSGTPDLRGKFVVGAGNTYNPGVSGGASTFTASGSVTIGAHVLTTAEMPSHRHPFQDYYGDSTGTGSASDATAGSTTSVYSSGTTPNAGSGTGHGHSSAEGTSFTGSAVTCMPRYYALCFIMKT